MSINKRMTKMTKLALGLFILGVFILFIGIKLMQVTHHVDNVQPRLHAMEAKIAILCEQNKVCRESSDSSSHTNKKTAP